MLRSTLDVHNAAYLGDICLCVPSFTAWTDEEGRQWEGMLDHMDDVFGQGSFDHGLQESRFGALLRSNTMLGDDLQRVFSHLKDEVHRDMADDDIPDDSPFKLGAAGVGIIRGEIKRRPQHEFTEAREDVQVAKLRNELKGALSRFRAAPARDVAAFLSCNVLSSQFVGVPSMRATVMDSAVFMEVWSIYLGTPSPACHNWVDTTSRGEF